MLTSSQLDQLEVMHWAAMLGKLSGALVHEVNNPASFITLAAGQLQKAAAESSCTSASLGPVGQLADDILVATNQMRVACDDFHLLRSSSQKLVSGSVDFNKLMGAVINLTRIAYRTPARIVADPAAIANPPASIALLGPSLVDLLINAIEAIPAADARERAIYISAQQRDKILVLSIRDEGVGMTPEVASHALDPFFTTRENASGLGLTLARHVAHRIDGNLELDTELGKGTTVRITVPT